jgi:alkanesulfonate monooxygenase SsuD/methylene tetrahydromethanopterin reductase-like flavin-dependent oxidoreductase (luciferase family)
VLAAEQVATLSALSAAPFVVQTGIGAGDELFAAMGVDRRERGARADEVIRVMKALLAGERVSSERLQMRDAAIAPLPPHGVEWWIGAGTGDRPLERAAREGDAWYASPGITAADIGRYRERCAAHGTEPRVVMRVDVLVGDEDAAAVRRGRELVAAGYRGMSEDVVAFGGVARVTERLAALAAVGVDDLVLRTMAVEQPLAVQSIELLGDVRRALSGPEPRPG